MNLSSIWREHLHIQLHIHYLLHIHLLLHTEWKSKVLSGLLGPQDVSDLQFLDPQPDSSQSCVNTGPACRTVCLFTSQLMLVPNYIDWWLRQMCVNDLSKAALDSAAAGIEPAIFSCKTNALTVTTTPPSHTRNNWDTTCAVIHVTLCAVQCVYVFDHVVIRMVVV